MYTTKGYLMRNNQNGGWKIKQDNERLLIKILDKVLIDIYSNTII